MIESKSWDERLNSGYASDLVFEDDPLNDGFVQHLSVPFLQPLWLWYLLLWRMTVKDVVVTLTGWTRPDVSQVIPVTRQSLFNNPVATAAWCNRQQKIGHNVIKQTKILNRLTQGL